MFSADSGDQLLSIEEVDRHPKMSNSQVMPATHRSSHLLGGTADTQGRTDENTGCYGIQEVMDEIASEKLPMATR